MAALFFEPVLPTESNVALVSSAKSVIDWNEAKEWVAPLPLRTIESNLQEVDAAPPTKRHKFVAFASDESKRRGNDAEVVFAELCAKRGWIPKTIADAEKYDYEHHVDAMLKLPNGKECWADVKCMRSLRRGWPAQSEHMWVELNNTGWLFGGKATCIAQQIGPRAFALFDREALAEYVKRAVDFKAPVVPEPEQCLERVYIRELKLLYKTKRSYLSLINTRMAFEAAGCGFLDDAPCIFLTYSK
jgi:hypothetical protein